MNQLELTQDYELSAYVCRAINLLRQNQPDDRPYWGCFSGGKDSVVIHRLATLANIDVNWYYSITTIDPPELVRFIMSEYPDVITRKPARSFFRELVLRAPPLRHTRWCCRILKERTPRGNTRITGVRMAESSRRMRWTEVATQTNSNDPIVNPILTWPDEIVWEFIRAEKIPYCKLYDEGFDRLGCIGCPMVSVTKRRQMFARWPVYESLWKKAVREWWEAKGQRSAQQYDTVYTSWEQYWEYYSNDSTPCKTDVCGQLFDWTEE